MPGTAEELDAYYTATEDAKELVRQNMLDMGREKWEHALKNVTQYISLEELDLCKREFANFLSSWEDERARKDTDSDSSEIDDTEDSDIGNGNDSADVDYRAEYSKLARKPTIGPSRSPTFLKLAPKRRETLQAPRLNFNNATIRRSHTHRADTGSALRSPEDTRTREPTTGGKPIIVSESTTRSIIDESNFIEPPESKDTAARSSVELYDGGLMGSKENTEWFNDLESKAHGFVYGKKREFWPTECVKVAVLDSGFALTGKARDAMKPYSSRIRDKKTFTHEFPNPKAPLENLKAWDDTVGHGTTVAYQLMKTCPSAHVYIAKVTVGDAAQKTPVPDKGAVARAIRHAATPVSKGGWGVDIINMSFGWSESELPGTDGVSSAIGFAEEQGVLLFAAASNYGLSQLNDVFYPARDPRVVSVDAEDGLGNPAPFALRSPRGGGGARYCAPGLSVDSPVSAVPMCGSSFACPVAAGIAALILEFSRYEKVSLSKSKTVRSALSTARGMSRVFGLMSQQADHRPGFNMLYPWHFLGHSHREKIALDIVSQLEIEFGKGNVGYEIEWEMAWKATQADESVV
ncbi:peptidase S8/S53 domain-containing protein [Nemania sp. FL0031]|nr:peptidase S8/S53 domain-containing protein [Nemania sp. FL0031]